MTRVIFSLLLMSALFIVSCSDDTTDPQIEQPDPSDLECEQLGYPCSLADTPVERIEAAVALLDEAWEQRHGGTMADTRAWLEAHPDVIEVFGDDRALRFRIEGCPPVWLTDNTGLAGSNPAAPDGDKAIIGEDTNEDGVVDNRDDKSALVLAPFHWEFQPHDESDLLAGQLESLRGYAENVTYKSNPDTTDQNIVLDDFLNWDDHDLIYVATHGTRLYDAIKDFSWTVIYTGISYDYQLTPDLTAPGVVIMAAYDGGESYQFTQLGLTADFFRYTYPEGLDDTLVLFTACKVGDVEGNRLAQAMAGDNFVMFGWTETVDTDDAFAATSLLLERLVEGQRAQHALDAVDDAGLRSVPNSDFNTTVLEHFSPNGGDQRLFELPQLLDDEDEVLEDGVDYSPRVLGTVGDGNPDSLALTVEIDGVTEGDMDAFVIGYRFDGDDLPGEFDLAGAMATGSFRYRAEHEVELGRDVEAGSNVALEVVVDLPEGGQTRFRVDVVFPEPGSGEIHECSPYIPTPVGDGMGGIWENPDSSGSASFSGPSDPGGGYWSVTASCEQPVNVRLIVRSGSDTATIFSESNQGTESPQSITAIFEAAPGWGYTAEAHQAVATNPENYPLGWSLSWSFTSLVDCYEPNQDSTQAKQLPGNIDNVTAYMVGGHRGNNLDRDDYDDWYKLVVTEPSQIEVDLFQSPEDIRMRMRLWGLNDNQLAIAGGNAPGDLAILTYEAQPGTYFLSVEAGAIGDGAVNTLFDETPDHLVTPYMLNVSTEPLR